MNLLLFLIYITAFILVRQRLFSASWSFAAVTSDLIASIQLTILSSFSPYACLFFLGLAVPYSLLDGLIYRATGLRMRISLFHYLRQWKSFWESAKELGIHRFFLFFLIWLSLSGLFATLVLSTMPSVTLGIALFGMSLCLAVLWKVPTHLRHQRLHPLILEQVEGIRVLFKKKEKRIGDWHPLQENYFCPSSDFPLFRFTKQFQGRKHFSLLPRTGQKPHIVFVFMESFRAKSSAVCDVRAPFELTPCFNQIAREGVLWRQFYCASARSYKAIIASLFGISCKKDEQAFHKAHNFPLRGLPEILKEEGYFNALLQGGDLSFDCMGEFAKAHAFDLMEGMQEIAAGVQPAFQGSFWGVNDELLMRRAVQVLKQRDREATPSFINLFTISNHHPWRLTSEGLASDLEKKIFYPTDNPYEARFQKTLHYADRCLGWLVNELEKEGLLEKSLLFILGDHGQPFSEHGEKFLDRDGLYEEQVKVPLLLLAKGQGIEPQKIDEVASQEDLVATVLDLLGIETFHHSLGRSLCREQKETVAMFHSPFFPHRIGVRKNQWKWIYHPETKEEELYDLRIDPSEIKNLAREELMTLNALREEGLTRMKFIEDLFEKKLLIPSRLGEEDHILDFSGQRELSNERLVGSVVKTPPVILKIDDCDAISDRAIYEIAPFCTRLKLLSMRNCSRISLRAFKTLCLSTQQLYELDISHCFCIGDEGLEEVFDDTTLLQRLTLEGHLFLGGASIVGLLKKTPKLRRLSLLGTAQICDAEMTSILSLCPELKFLKLDVGRLTDASLEAIAKNAHHLIGIYLVNCQQITDEGLAVLGQRPNLSSVVLIDCPLVKGSFLKSWKKIFFR